MLVLVLAGFAVLAPEAKVWAQAAQQDAARRPFDIPAGTLDDALSAFGAAAGTMVGADTRLTAGLRTAGLRGSYTVTEGLRLILAGTGLEAVLTASGGYQLRRIAPQPGVAALPALRVTGERDLREEAYERPAAVSVVTKADMDRIQARHASDILQAVPGVFTVTNEQNPSISVDIRGLKDFGRVNMSIDGMRQNYQRTGHGQRNGEMFIDTELLAGVGIEKGPIAGLGGLGVIGGVANFRTIEFGDVVLPGQVMGARLRGSTGVGKWRNGQKFAGSAAAGIMANDDLDFLFAAASRRSDAYQPGKHGYAFYEFSGYDLPPLGLVNLTNQEQDSYLFKTRWRPAPAHEFKFTALHTRLSFAETAMMDLSDSFLQLKACNPMPAPGEPNYVFCESVGGTDAFDPSKVYPQHSSSSVESTSLALDYGYKPAGNDAIDLHAKLYYVNTDNHTVNTRDTASTFITRTSTLGASLSNTSLLDLGRNWSLEWDNGFEVFLDRNRPDADSTQYSARLFKTGATPRGNRLLAGAYTRASFQYSDWLKITPGLRYEYARLWGNTSLDMVDENYRPLRAYANIDVDNRWARWLPSLNVAVMPHSSLQLFANAAKGWRPPAITEGLIAGEMPGHTPPIRYYPNYLLKPEESTTYELGANLRLDRLLRDDDQLRVKAVWFRSKTDNYTFFTNHMNLPGGMPNNMFNHMFVQSLDPTVYRGIELEANYDAGGWFASLGLTRLERDATFRNATYPLGRNPGDPAGTTDNGSDRGGVYIPGPPKYSGRLTGGMRLLARKLELSATVRCAGKGGHPDLWDQSAPDAVYAQESYCVWDAQLVYRPTDSFMVGLTMRNIADRQYAQAMGDAYVRSLAPGRTLLLNTELRF